MFKKFFDEYDGVPELQRLSMEQNIRRIPWIAAIFLLYECLTLLSGIDDESKSTQLSVFVIIIICVSYLVLSLVGYNWIMKERRRVRITYMSFWILIILIGMTSFFMLDLQKDAPVNITMMVGVILTTAMFSKIEAILVYALLGLYVESLYFIYDASAMIRIYTLVLCIAAIIISVIFQRNYKKTILSLKLETMSDALTNILNRRGGINKLKMVFELCRRHNMNMAVFWADIDYFKRYNDTYGHLRGDQVLIEVSREMERIFGRSSDVVSRFGGEEFVLCTSVASYEDAAMMAERLRQAVEALCIPAPTQEISKFVTISVGYIVYDNPEEDQEKPDDDILLEILEKSDEALYYAKSSGRNQIVDYKDIPKEA